MIRGPDDLQWVSRHLKQVVSLFEYKPQLQRMLSAENITRLITKSVVCHLPANVRGSFKDSAGYPFCIVVDVLHVSMSFSC